ncbi:MAG: VOC family protein [Pyrinomonadaceae bacterium]|nr:VOC family protein [Pyrinomonadaceae bacterium]
MRIQKCTLYVDDQEKALNFYTNILGFEKKSEKPMGDGKMLAIVAPQGNDNLELHLELTFMPESRRFQKALYAKGMPQAEFEVENLEKEHATLTIFGVRFEKEPFSTGDATRCMIDDTCGNLIEIYQKNPRGKERQKRNNNRLGQTAVPGGAHL